MSYLVRQTYREQNVRWVERAGGAGRAGRSAYAVKVEHEQQALALYSADRNVHVSRKALVSVAVQTGLRYLEYAFYQLVAQSGDPNGLFRNIGAGSCDSLSQTYYSGNVLRARSLAALLCAARDEVRQSYAVSDIKCADALWCVDLVTRK